jgi:hypothetical protein
MVFQKEIVVIVASKGYFRLGRRTIDPVQDFPPFVANA